MCQQPATLFVYNTVERLLRGDFFHCVTQAQVEGDLARFQAGQPVAGVGTSNWHRRHGELIVDGLAGRAQFLWADPASQPAGRLIDLARDLPEWREHLVTPAPGLPATTPHFPFVAVAVGSDAARQELWAPPGVSLHAWLEAQVGEANIGLAGLTVEGEFEAIDYTTICHIPFEGLDLRASYSSQESFRFGRTTCCRWRLSGIYAANPTIQAMVSVIGHGLHAHGYDLRQGVGGHVNGAITAGPTRVCLWPVSELVLRIADLRAARAPVSDLL